MDTLEIQTIPSQQDQEQEEEEFRDVKFFEHYEVSSNGKVRNKRTGYILKNSVNNIGYEQVVLSEYGFSKNIKVHRLVAEAFLKNIHNKPCIDHIDGNKLNNHASNIRFCTKSENGMNRMNLNSNNTSGHVGVNFDKSTNQWKAYIRVNSKKMHLGRFDTFEEALKVREDAEDVYFGEFKHKKIKKE